MEKIFSILENINKLFEQKVLVLEDEFEFIDFIETSPATTAGDMKILFLTAVLDIPFSGRSGLIPINNVISEWIKNNELKIAPILWKNLKEYVNDKYTSWNGDAVDKYMETHDSPINQNQTEFYPEFQEDDSLRVMIDLELILEK